VAETEGASVLDDEEWEKWGRYWRALVEEILASVGEGEAWPSWEPKFYGDGITPMEREHQSICDGRSWRLDRAFAIQQTPSTSALPTIGAWVNDYVAGLLSYGDIKTIEDAERWYKRLPARERVPRSTLVISLEYSEPAIAEARSLLEVWLKPETTVDEMKRVIAQTEN
jgi:hypothetical protein